MLPIWALEAITFTSKHPLLLPRTSELLSWNKSREADHNCNSHYAWSCSEKPAWGFAIRSEEEDTWLHLLSGKFQVRSTVNSGPGSSRNTRWIISKRFSFSPLSAVTPGFGDPHDSVSALPPTKQRTRSLPRAKNYFLFKVPWDKGTPRHHITAESCCTTIYVNISRPGVLVRNPGHHYVYKC